MGQRLFSRCVKNIQNCGGALPLISVMVFMLFCVVLICLCIITWPVSLHKILTTQCYKIEIFNFSNSTENSVHLFFKFISDERLWILVCTGFEAGLLGQSCPFHQKALPSPATFGLECNLSEILENTIPSLAAGRNAGKQVNRDAGFGSFLPAGQDEGQILGVGRE